ncbi:glycosyltransferase family 2 protein [Candidatus Pelagibacter sp. HIMB1521]|uniref:glycosyltransferase family 2 protein n=1 Tax=Candidatus Pelagibacter sp. HIMB1521 TaxID=3413344 RepID=UPI003F86AE90
MKTNEKISIVIPCYNEEKTISTVIDNSIKSIKQITDEYELIVVDDASYDQSKVILKEYFEKKNIKLFTHDNNLGKGAALNTAFKHTSGKIIIIQDADLEYNPDEYVKILIPFIEADADVVYGSRFLGGGRYARLHFFWHYLANKLLTFFCNLVTNINMTDMETGFKAFRKSCLDNINLIEKSFGFEPEITIKLAKKKLKFYEVSISYNGRTYSEGKKIGIKDAFRAFYCIIKYSLIK